MKRLVYTLGCLALLASCKHDTGPQPAANPGTNPGTGDTTTGGTPGGVDTSLCFERDVLPIFISNCAKAGCHDAASHQEGYVFTNWATITAKKFVPGQPDKTELYEAITEHEPDERMPPLPATPLTAAQIATIRSWILRGAPNTTGCAVACDTATVTFSGKIQPLLNQYCTGCHSGPTPSGGISLASHAGAKQVADNGRLLGAVRRAAGYSPMPQGGAKLSDCQIRLIEKWVAAGAANN